MFPDELRIAMKERKKLPKWVPTSVTNEILLLEMDHF
jgi:hypothetical protein